MSPIFRRRVGPRTRINTGRPKKSPRSRLMLQALEERAVPSAYTVNLADDTNAGGGGVSTGVNTGDLRWCFEQARIGGAEDTITFAGGVTTTLAAALPTYTDTAALTITGEGKTTTTIIAPANNRIFDFNVSGATPSITITDLALQGGNVTTGYGGAIRNDNEILALTNVAFTNNTAVSGGGALSITSAVSTLKVTGCDFTANTATSATTNATTGGGAIFLGGGVTVTLTSSVFDANRATSGSALFAGSSINLNSDSCTFQNGQSFGTGATHTGGAMLFESGASTILVDHAIVTGNTTGRHGGFIYTVTANAQVTVQNSSLSSNSAAGNGGAIRTFSTSAVTINNCSFTNNTAGGIGGAVHAGNTLSVTKSIFSGNTATGIGGAIYSSGISTTTTNITTSIFSNNTSSSSTGGGAVRSAGLTTISFSQFTNNTSAGSGGALFYTAGTVTLNNSTFSKNTADLSGGAINNASSGSSTTLIVNESTFNNNTAAGSGAGIGGGAIATSSAGGVAINNSTIYGNAATGSSTATGGGGILRISGSAISFNLISTIVSNNVLPNGTVGIDLFSSSTVSVAGTKNLIGTNDNSSVTFTTPASNQLGTNASKINAKLGSLVDNGGEAGKVLKDGTFVKTMALQNGSPALNQGLANGFSNDQRGAGFARDDGSGVDVGAFEGLGTIPTAQLTSAPNVTSSGNASYSFDVTYDDDSGFVTTTFDTNDVMVTGPGFVGGQKATAVNVAGSGKTYVVTYTIPAPTNGWGGVNTSKTLNIGAYTVTLNGGQVSDDSTNFVPGDTLGTFKTAFALGLSVDENTDVDDNDLSPGKLSFREALRVSNSNALFVDTITFDSTVFTGSTTLTLTAGTRTISDSVVINGQAAVPTISANKTNQQFTIAPNQAVTISNLKFTQFSGTTAGAVFTMGNGTIWLDNTQFIANSTTVTGGGALNTAGAASVKVTNSSFTNNTVTGTGAALRFSVTGAVTATITNSTFSGNSASSVGGAIYGTTLANITISGSTFSSNTGSQGGAIRASSTSSSVSINTSTFTSNRASSTQGGAADLIGSVTISQSTFTGNFATSNGGAVYLGSSATSATISRSLFSNNTANATTTFSGGGAIVAGSSATVTLSNSQFNSNTAKGNGGAIRVNSSASVTLTNDTFRGNTAALSGGGLFDASTIALTINQNTFTSNSAAGVDGGGAIGHSTTGAMTINNSTIYNNTASGSATTANGGGIARTSSGTLTFISTIVSNNKVTGSGTGGIDLYSTTTVSLGAGTHHNLVGNNDNSNVSFTDVTTNLLGNTGTPIDANLAAINDYGGEFLLPDGSHVQTMPLLAGSPALDVGNSNGFTNDQRGAGFARVINGGIANQADIGAAEGVLLPPTVTSVVFGDGTAQRSLVKQIVVTFSEPVTFMGDVTAAFTLSRSGTGGPTGNVTLSSTPVIGPASQVTITFSGALTDPGGSLIDGFYDLVISAAVVSGGAGALDGNNDTIAGGNYSVIGNTSNKFFRLFGDADGDATTTLADFAAFRGAFNLGPSLVFDFDNDGNVSLSDFAAFRARFNLSP